MSGRSAGAPEGEEQAAETPHRAGLVGLAGRPNVGKSTLLNRLIGTKISIVSDKPQTTRNRITGVLHLPHAQVVLVDTPGVHRPLHRMNERMMRAALSVLEGVDLVCVLTDVTEESGGGDRYLVETLKKVPSPVFLVVNKVDLVRKKGTMLPILESWSKRFAFAEIFPISAATGEGVDALLAGIVARLPEGPPLFPEDEVTDVTERFLVAEIVREKVLHTTEEEVPYSTTVFVESFEEEAPRTREGEPPPEEGARGLVRIEATVLVERESQKPILIGRQGERIKKIGSDARREIEELLGCRVWLGLQVKVGQRWRDDERVLDRLGMER